MGKKTNISKHNGYDNFYSYVLQQKNKIKKKFNKKFKKLLVGNCGENIFFIKKIFYKYIDNLDIYQLSNTDILNFIDDFLSNISGKFGFFYTNLLIKSIESGYDYLTNIFNRRTGELRLKDIHNESIKRNKTYTLFMIDVDNFKQINDIYGHLVGDGVLKFVAYKLVQSCRPEDVVCRYGGEEFMLVLPNLTYKQVVKKANDIISNINNNKIDNNGYTELENFLHKFLHNCANYDISNIPKNISVSIGSKTFFGVTDKNLYKSYSDIISLADRALYISKKRGKNCFTAIEIESNIDPNIELINNINKLYVNDIKKILSNNYPYEKIKNLTIDNIDVSLINDIKILNDLKHIFRKIIKENKDKFLYDYIGIIIDNIIKRIGEIHMLDLIKKKYPDIKI